MIAFLTGQQTTKTYMPERLEIIGDLPRTPRGKIRKFKIAGGGGRLWKSSGKLIDVSSCRRSRSGGLRALGEPHRKSRRRNLA